MFSGELDCVGLFRVHRLAGNSAVHCPSKNIPSFGAAFLPHLKLLNSRTRRVSRLHSNSSESEQPEGAGQEIAEFSQENLDWRKFRAGLIAQERKERQIGNAHQDCETDRSSGGQAAEAPGKENVDIWAHQISAPETGCLLLAKKSGGNMGLFNNSVILLLQHKTNSGSLGLMLGRKLKKQRQGPFAQVMAMIAGLYLGGPVSLDSLLTLHSPPGMANSLQLLNGIYIGGWREAQEMLTALDPTTDTAPTLSVFSGSCGWSPYQLEHEEKTGAWWVVSASPQCIQMFLEEAKDEDFIRRKVLELADIEDL